MIYGALRKELQNDPVGVGYSTMTAQEVADAMNEETRTRQDFSFTGAQLINAIDASEWGGLTDVQKSQIKMLIGAGGTLDASAGTTVRSLILGVFGSESNTVSQLQQVAETSLARWEELGLGEPVRVRHVEQVRS